MITEDKMEANTFIDRFFHSSYELTDFRHVGERDINSLYTFLNLLHSLNDRFSKQFGITQLAKRPEFKLLRLIRNYFQHVGDVDEFRLFQTRDAILTSHMEMIIIPTALVARAIESFRNQPHNKKNPVRAEKELSYIASAISDFEYLCDNTDLFRENPPFHDTDNTYFFGFDLYKSVYNITNIVADICRKRDEFAIKKCVQELEKEYTEINNIPKENILLLAGSPPPLLTTQGFVFPKRDR